MRARLNEIDRKDKSILTFASLFNMYLSRRPASFASCRLQYWWENP